MKMSGRKGLPPPILRRRYLHGWSAAVLGTPAFTTAGRAWMNLIEVPWKVLVDRLIYQVGAVSAGNVRAGLYREGPTIDIPDGGSLVVESGSEAQGAISVVQALTIPETILTPGRYYLGVMGDDVTGQIRTTYGSAYSGVAYPRYYNRVAGYGSFTNPCPVTTSHGHPPWVALRVVRNYPLEL